MERHKRELHFTSLTPILKIFSGCLANQTLFYLDLPAALQYSPIIQVVHHGRHCTGHLHNVVNGQAFVTNFLIISLNQVQSGSFHNKDLHGVSSCIQGHPSSIEKEKGGKEYRLLKLAKDPVATSDAPGCNMMLIIQLNADDADC